MSLADEARAILNRKLSELHDYVCPKCGGNISVFFGENTCMFCGAKFDAQLDLAATYI